MLFRKMPRIESELSILGFGCMRLPVQADGHIDEPLATEMLRYAIDHGVNYVDTAYPYHNGESEPFVGRALQNGYRGKVNLATKLPTWLINSRSDMDRYLDEQLVRLQTDRVEFYLVHALSKASWEKVSQLGILEFLDAAVADGRIRYSGFSFHDKVGVFKEIVDAYDWAFCQIQYNFMDEEYQAGTEGLRYAAQRGIGVVVMEPLRGGVLAKGIAGISDLWREAPSRRSPADWALRWVWDKPEVAVVLSGMSTREQVVQNVSCAENALPSALQADEFAIFEKVKAEYQQRIKVPCTKCDYCLPCPSGVNIPVCFEMYNLAHMYEAPDHAKGSYNFMLRGARDGSPAYASQCEECGTCEELCPQGITTRERLKEVAAFFGK
jgi:uncharacterized protein